MKIKVIGNFIFLSNQTKNTLEKLGELSLHDVNADEEALIKYGYDADIIITWGKPTAKMISKCPDLKFIGYMFTGYDAIVNDPLLVKALLKHNVTIAYAPGYAVEGVSDYAVSSLLAGIRKIVPAILNNRKSGYKEMFFNYMGGSINGSKVGIIGMGNIGSAVAQKLHGLGAEILSYTKHPDTKKLEIPVKFMSLKQLFKSADHIVITAQLNKETTSLITKDLLLALPESAVVVNAARGKIINLDDLAQVAAQRLDMQFFIDEIEADPQLLKKIVAHDNVFITPHFAAIAMPTMLKCTEIVTKNLVNYLQGKEFDKIPLT
jgi:glycerate dehydrogenase